MLLLLILYDCMHAACYALMDINGQLVSVLSRYLVISRYCYDELVGIKIIVYRPPSPAGIKPR